MPFKRRLRSKTRADECKERADDKGITDRTWLTAKQLKSEAHTQAEDYMHRAEERGLVRINLKTGCTEVLYTKSTWIVGSTKDAIMTPADDETSSSATTYVSDAENLPWGSDDIAESQLQS